MTKEEVENKIGNAEGDKLEYKSAKGGFPNSFWETLSAFANTDGGLIVLGVKEKNGVLEYDGLSHDQIEQYKKIFWDGAHNRSVVSAVLLTNSDVFEIERETGSLLVFSIPRAPYNIRPVFLTRNPLGNTFRRNHEGDYHCSDSETRLMMADAESQSHSFDSQILPSYTMDDIDASTLHAFRQRFSLRHDNHPWNSVDDMTFLTKIGAYRFDRQEGREGFTRASILMFGKSDSITDPVCAPNYFVDYQEWRSSDPMMRWTDRIYPDGTWEANLFQFFFRVYGKLGLLLPRPFILKGTERQEENPLLLSLREALVNCLVHCNYACIGNILIIYKNGDIIMRNPGSMLVSVDDFYAGSHSVCRNNLLQKFFMLLGYGEKAGSGADIITIGWRSGGFCVPVLAEKRGPEEIEMVFSFEHDGCSMETANDDEYTDGIKDPKCGIKDPKYGIKDPKYGIKDGTKELSERQLTILRLIEENGTITTKLMAQKTGMAQRTLMRELEKLQENGLLIREGGRKEGRWIIL